MFLNLSISVFLLWMTAAPFPAVAGEVVAVHNGDTFTINTGAFLYKVRLADVDAPELGQVFGKQARRFTEEKVLGLTVRVNVVMIDRYGRLVGEVIVEDGRVLNEELVHAGLAWYYRVNPFLNRRLERLEHDAFAKKLGLWVEKEPLPPWEFRRESLIPDVPLTFRQVDYDKIFHYGLIGDYETKMVHWPACKNYLKTRIKKAIVFLSLQQARKMGFRPAAECPR